MDWGNQPYWNGISPKGPNFLRTYFRRLEIFSLIFVGRDQVDRTLYWPYDCDFDEVFEEVKSRVLRQFDLEKSGHPEWHMPEIRFFKRRDFLRGQSNLLCY
jgi:hypothetical protein